MYKNLKLEIIYIFFVLFLVVAQCIFLNPGLYGIDDIEYSNLSYKWANGQFKLSDNHFTYRTPLIIFTGIIYKLFGPSDFTTALPSIILILIICLLIWKILSCKDTRVVLTAISIFAISYPVIIYSNKPMPDIYIAFFILLSLFFHYKYTFEKKNKPFLYSFSLSFSLFFAFITKEIVIIILPLFLVLCIMDIYKYKTFKFWAYSLIIFSVLLVIYHYYIYCKTGSFFSRYIAVINNSYENPCNYENYPFTEVLKRISYQLWYEFIKYGVFMSLVFIVPFLRKKLFAYNKYYYWFFVMIIMLLLSNFMTKSYKAYSPMCIDIRHYIYIIPVTAIALSSYIVKFFYSHINLFRKTLSFVFSFILTTILFIDNNLPEMQFTYFIFSVTILVNTVLSKFYQIKNFSFLLFFMCYFLSLLYFSLNTLNNNTYKYIKPFVEKHFLSNKENKIVFCDIILKRIAEYYLKWDTIKVQFIDKTGLYQPCSSNNKKYFYYANSYSWWLAKELNKFNSIFDWNLNPNNIKLIDNFYDNKLYEITQPQNILVKSNKYFFFCNHEFDYYANFIIYKNDIKFYNLNKYNHIPASGFSTTFLMNSKNLSDCNFVKLEISYSCKILYKKSGNSQIVLEIRNYADSCVFWCGKKISEIIKPSKNWQTLNYNISYQVKDNKFIIKLYIWNNDNYAISVDDIKIEIIEISHL